MSLCLCPLRFVWPQAVQPLPLPLVTRPFALGTTCWQLDVRCLPCGRLCPATEAVFPGDGLYDSSHSADHLRGCEFLHGTWGVPRVTDGRAYATLKLFRVLKGERQLTDLQGKINKSKTYVINISVPFINLLTSNKKNYT